MSATIQQKTTEALKTETEAKPKFIQKRENLQENYSYYSQSSIDSNTKHCVARLKEATTTISLTTKGQLISKCLFEKIIWTKIPPKNLIDSALKVCVNFQGRIYQIFWWYFGPNDFFKKTF